MPSSHHAPGSPPLQVSGALEQPAPIPRVAIVGGGPGGLFTAYRLQLAADQPFQLTLFEADERLGGKIRTGRFTRAAVNYELGAAELYDNSPVGEDPLRLLVAELGLSVTAMAGQSVISRGRILSNLDDVQDAFGAEAREALLAFDREARGRMAPRQFYDSDQAESFVDEGRAGGFAELLARIPNRAAREYVGQLIHSDLATEPERTNLRYGLQNYLMNDPAYMLLYSIDGGNERLPRALAERLQAEVVLGHRLEQVDALPDGRTRLTFEGAQAKMGAEFDFVVLALPHPALRAVRFASPSLATSMASHLAHYDHPADYLRVSILFERPFWRGVLNDSFCMLDQFDGCCLYDESSRIPDARHGVLGWLLGGQAARDMAGWSDERLVDAVLDTLPTSLAHGRELVLESTVHRWLGSVSAMPGGRVARSLDQRHHPAPIESPNLFLVGDYLFDSTLNGVLESAEYVAHGLAARLAEDAAARR